MGNWTGNSFGFPCVEGDSESIYPSLSAKGQVGLVWSWDREAVMIVLRQVIGDELRRRRQDQGRTLRDVSGAASVSLGYLSEVERGQKEASSELLAAICDALEVPLSDVLASVSNQVARAEYVS